VPALQGTSPAQTRHDWLVSNSRAGAWGALGSVRRSRCLLLRRPPSGGPLLLEGKRRLVIEMSGQSPSPPAVGAARAGGGVVLLVRVTCHPLTLVALPCHAQPRGVASDLPCNALGADCCGLIRGRPLANSIRPVIGG
jgi:hypothetical protein